MFPRAGELAVVPTFRREFTCCRTQAAPGLCKLKRCLVRSLREATKQQLCHCVFSRNWANWSVSVVAGGDDSWSGDEMWSRLLVTDFCDEAFAHDAGRDEFRAVVMHLL